MKALTSGMGVLLLSAVELGAVECLPLGRNSEMIRWIHQSRNGSGFRCLFARSRSFELALFWHANYTNNVAPRLSIINSYQIFATNSMRMEGTPFEAPFFLHKKFQVSYRVVL